MVYIPDPSGCGEEAGGVMELSKLIGLKNVNAIMMTITAMVISIAITNGVTHMQITHSNCMVDRSKKEASPMTGRESGTGKRKFFELHTMCIYS